MKLTTAQAIVKYLIAQRTTIDGAEAPLFPGVFAIFGHGNVTCLGQALEEARDELPTWRGQNEQGMALAAVGFAKAMRRRQIMIATSSIGPGATNMVTAAAVAHSNRLPLLLMSGDTFRSRIPDPVLQQVEHFHDPSMSVNDAFKAVTRYWDRIVSPEQVVHSLPHAVATMLDPATCGPVFLGLPQDAQAEAFEYPDEFFDVVVHEIHRPRPDLRQIEKAAAVIRSAERPLIICGGGVHYSFAESELQAFAERFRIPVVETVAGKATLVAAHPLNAGPVGVTGCQSANALAADADVVIAVGSRLQDFTTGSWTAFQRSAQFVGINTAGFDAIKHSSTPVIGDARETLAELTPLLGDWSGTEDWVDRAARETHAYHTYIDKIAAPTEDSVPTYAQVIGVVDRAALPTDYAVSAAGGLPGELGSNWRAKGLNSYDCEYGFSCMGYEISGAWGAKMAMPDREVIVFLGDGSYMMMNSDLYSSVLTGHKLIVIVCDNGGFAVIHRLQVNQGGAGYNNLYTDTRHKELVEIDFAGHARSMGCEAETVTTVAELAAAFERARAAERTYVIAVKTTQFDWTEGGTFWEVGVPEISDRQAVVDAHQRMESGKQAQRLV
jgi:3D-(3,5/4)-trihydroxycyclohexane-1,2-dione acylhydrolase (decyclizing)